MTAALKYRPEIDGLRAVAVVAVVAFHLDPDWLAGGFLGVDVFFVISGYLITSIIQRGLDNGRFSLRQFWLRRIKRLYPALFVMLAVVSLCGNYVLISPERSDLVFQTTGALFSFSNILLWQTTGGYWDNSSENIALLHTWSLSLEEQFYIVFPPLLLLTHKVARRLALPLTVAMACVSLALSISSTPSDRSGAFYLLPTRMWELAIGSLLAMAQLSGKTLTLGRRLASSLASVGMVTVLLSLCLIENDEHFPSARPLFPCLGTVLLLAFASADGLCKTLLSLPPVVYVGRISYSLYLWHWPVIVFGRFLSPADNTLILLALPVVCASLSYHFIETPFRAGFRGSGKALAAMFAAVGLCLLPIAVVAESPGLPARLADLETDEQVTRARRFEATPSLKHGSSGVTIGVESNAPDIVVVGSSHARVLTPPIADYAEESGCNLEVLATSGIGIAKKEPHAKRDYADTVHTNRTTRLKSLRAKVGVVADMWTSQTRLPGFSVELCELLTLLAGRCDHVLVVSQAPMIPLPTGYRRAFNKYILASERSGRGISIEPDKRVAVANATVEAIVDDLSLDNVRFVNTYDTLLTETEGVKLFADGRLLYFDNHHLNHHGAAHVFNHALRAMIERALQ